MFEAQTFDKLMEDVLQMAPPGIDTRKGSIFYDAVSATVNKIAKLYTDLDRVFELVFITTATEGYLDLRAEEFGMFRHPATPAKYYFEYTGTRPDIGWRFFHNDSGLYFTLMQTDAGILYLEAEEPGELGNIIQSGDIGDPSIHGQPPILTFYIVLGYISVYRNFDGRLYNSLLGFFAACFRYGVT